MSMLATDETLISSHAEAMDVGAELRLGIDLHRQGRPLEAEQRLQRVLQQDPGSFDALHLLGVIAAQTGRTFRAVDLISQAISRNSNVVTAHLNLALALKELGRPDEAVASLKRAIALRPDLAAAHVSLSAVFIDMKRFDSALECAERALAVGGNSMSAQLNRAAALRGLGRLEESLEGYDRAIAMAAESASAWMLRGHVLMDLARAEQALASYQQALALAPDSAEAPSSCGWALLQLNRPREALACYEHALRQGASSAAVHANRAAVYLALHRPEPALACCEQALQLRPDLFEAHFNRGAALHALHRHAAAREALEQALSLRPRSAAAHCELGNVCREMDERRAAHESYRRTLEIEPDNPSARLGLLLVTIPVIPGSREEVDRSRLELAAELSRFDAWVLARQSLDEPVVVGMAQPFYLAYQERANRDLLTRWGTLVTGLMERWAQRVLAPAARPAVTSDFRVRVGIVTSHAYRHSVFRALLQGWLEHLDRDRIHVTVFHLGVSQDVATAAARRQAEWVDCSSSSLPERIGEIRSRNIEVLIYPEVGMDGGTFQLASLRIAPHQIVAWGHPETTGLPTMDYFLSAAAFEPAAAEHNYSEKLVALPGVGCYYEPFGISGTGDRDELAIAPNVPVLLSAGTPYKYAAERDAVLVEIARELGECRIVLFEASQQTLSARVLARLQARFRDAGLDPARYLLMLPWLSVDRFFGLMRHADVYLDTLGFSGFNTVMQAVECELPIVAFEGRFMRGRFASGVLRSLGLDELVAGNEAEYVRQAVALARDGELRERVRARLRSQRQQLYRNRAAIDAMTEFINALPR
jgi:protein O-GlcNAc transferase